MKRKQVIVEPEEESEYGLLVNGSKTETCFDFGRQLLQQQEILDIFPSDIAVLIFVYLGDTLYPPHFMQGALICTKVSSCSLNCVTISYHESSRKERGLSATAQKTIIQDINRFIKDRRSMFTYLPRVGPYGTAEATR